jgi:hypothetical protein
MAVAANIASAGRTAGSQPYSECEGNVVGNREEANENWGVCPKCGEPVLIDPVTNQPQLCANCASMASKPGIAMGVLLVVAGIVGIAVFVYGCIRILL